MNIQIVKKILNEDYFDFSIGDSINKVVEVMGKPNDSFEQKKYKIIILKYEGVQLTFISNVLTYYSFRSVEDEIDVLFKEVNKEIFNNNFQIERDMDFFTVKFKDHFILVFSNENESLFEIKVK